MATDPDPTLYVRRSSLGRPRAAPVTAEALLVARACELYGVNLDGLARLAGVGRSGLSRANAGDLPAATKDRLEEMVAQKEQGDGG